MFDVRVRGSEMSDTKACTPLQVALIGHSFIARLNRYMRSHPHLGNLDLSSDNFNIRMHARGGLRTCHLARSSHMFDFQTTPDLCYLHIGENDINCLEVDHIVRNILSIASYLHEGIGVRSVVIEQLLHRQPWASPDFNAKVVEINIRLQERVPSHLGVHFWRHRGF